jgi:hypothetical protein
VKRQEKLRRFEQHRDNADDLLRQAGTGPFERRVEWAARANAHVTMALVYLTDLLADDG